MGWIALLAGAITRRPGRLLLGLAAAAVLGPWAVPDGALAAAPFRVGTAVININPTVPTYPAGFAAGSAIAPGHVAGQPLSVRALYISNGRSAIELEAIDSQAEFAAYQEGSAYGLTAARDSAAATINAAGVGPRIGPQDIIIQATHGHATPTLEGLWGPVPITYLEQATKAEHDALVRAAASAQPAELRFGSADASSLDDVALAQYDAFPGWPDDPLLTVLWAVSPRTGATIASYATIPAHPDIVCGQCLGLENADYPGLVRAALAQQLGGTAIVGPGTLGREETPVQATSIADDQVFAADATDLVDRALANAKPLRTNTLAGTEQFVQIPGTEPLLLALVEAYSLPASERQDILNASGEYPIDRDDSPPYQDGPMAGTWVTAVRLGNVAYLSMPGEPFPEIRQTLAAAAPKVTVVALSKGQDDLGYFYPSYVTPFSETYPSDTFTNSASADTGDVVMSAQDSNLRALGWNAAPISTSPLPIDGSQTVSPGLQVIGGPFTTDAGADGKASVELLPTFSPPDLPEGTLDYGLPAGSAPVANQASGPVSWNFGDGTATSGYHNFSGSDAAPTVLTRGFSVGTHRVRATITDATGRQATTDLTITVYPTLHVKIAAARHGKRVALRALITGGDGHLLASRWQLGHGCVATGPTAHCQANGARIRLAVTDGTGTLARAQVRLSRS